MNDVKTKKDLKLGVYKHYKGDKYRVHCIATHTETLEQMVVYQALYAQQDWWVRPLAMFSSTVLYNGIEQLRFTYSAQEQ